MAEENNKPSGWKEGEPSLGIVVARKGAGKTHTTKEKIIQPYLKGDPSTGAEARRFLIIDCNDEYTDVKSIMVDDIPEWCDRGPIEVRRIRIFDLNGKRWSLDQIQDNALKALDFYYAGGCLLEDMTKYVNDQLPGDLIGTIATQRHQECDMVIQFQLIQKLAHPKIWGLCNWVRMHRPEDTVRKHENDFSGNIDGLFLLEALVRMKNKEGHKYFFAFFDKDDMKVRGAFNKRDFARAIDYYLSSNPISIKRAMQEMDLRTGEGKYKSRLEAINAKRNEYMTEYYGNPQ